MITMTCPKCGLSLRAPADGMGKHAKCPRCMSLVEFPTAVATASAPPADRRVDAAPPTEDKLCPYCGEWIKALARKCRFCGEMLDEDEPTQHVEHTSGAPRLATCPRCQSTETSEYLPTRWKCFKCGAKFIIEEAPSIVVQPTREMVIHTGPTDTRRLERGVETLSGVRRRPGRPHAKVCPRCGSTYLNRVGDGNKVTQKMQCHNCGYTYDTFNGFNLVVFLILLVLVIGFVLFAHGTQ